jgi:hypothetical protein
MVADTGAFVMETRVGCNPVIAYFLLAPTQAGRLE